MNWPAQCAGVIPCLNEAATIGSLVRAIRAHVPTVIVVDDGSTDATAKLAAQAGAEVIRHDKTRGKGAALTSGLRRARERGFAWALLMDGDNQHSPEDIPAFLACAEQGQAGLIIGNRMIHAGDMPWLRRQVNVWMSRRLSRLSGRVLPDSQCGFRLMQLESWAALNFQTSHFEFESEMVLAFAAAGLGIEFVPIRVIYRKRASNIRPWRDTWRWFRWLGQRHKLAATNFQPR